MLPPSGFDSSLHQLRHTIAGFMEKNRDDLPRETVDLPMKSKIRLCTSWRKLLHLRQVLPPIPKKASKSRRDASNGSAAGPQLEVIFDGKGLTTRSTPRLLTRPLYQPNELFTESF
jgi:hypothetical protein